MSTSNENSNNEANSINAANGEVQGDNTCANASADNKVAQEGQFIPANSKEKPEVVTSDYVKGLNDGIKIGVEVGVNYAINEVKKIIPAMIEDAIRNAPDVQKAVSSGVRSGNSECAKLLVNKYKYKKSSFPEEKKELSPKKNNDNRLQVFNKIKGLK